LKRYFFLFAKRRKLGEFINDDDLLTKIEGLTNSLLPATNELVNETLAPIGNTRSLWACGVTYLEVKWAAREQKQVEAADFMQKYMKQKDLKYF